MPFPTNDHSTSAGEVVRQRSLELQTALLSRLDPEGEELLAQLVILCLDLGADVFRTADLRADLRRTPPRVDNSELIAEHDGWRARATEHRARLEATLNDDQRPLLEDYSDARTDEAATGDLLLLAEVRRHLPGLAPALMVLEGHLTSQMLSDRGVCCGGGS